MIRRFQLALTLAGLALLVAASGLAVRDWLEPGPGESVVVHEPDRDLGAVPAGSVVEVVYRVTNSAGRDRRIVNFSQL